MPSVQIVIHQASGAAIVLSPGDRLEKIVTIECVSQRCASRNGLDKPKEVSLTEGEPMPEGGDQWMSLILPERSPQFSPMPPNFCSPQCVKDFLVYQYLAPGPRQPSPDLPTSLDGPELGHTSGNGEFARGTDKEAPVTYPAGEYIGAPGFGGEIVRITDNLEPMSAMQLGFAMNPPKPEPLAQADGFVEGENPRGPSIF